MDVELPQTSSDSAEQSFTSAMASSRDTWASDSWDLGGYKTAWSPYNLIVKLLGSIKAIDSINPSNPLRRMSSKA